ncbi:MAG: flippase-like domain-containing protein [Rhodothermales bacterium]|nr:flippase-like domain-containing protein [Rhodothermales bacterium]
MKPTARKWLVRGGSFLLAGLLLYLALGGVDFAAVGRALAEANWWWLVPMAAAILLSHWLRAVRWRYLLVALPESRTSDPPVSDRLAFMATMIGYMANYAGPRVGELIRGGTVAARTNLRFPSVFGTIVAERILDTATLAVAMLTVPFIFGDELSRVADMLWMPVSDLVSGLSPAVWILIGVAILAAGAAGLWLLLPLFRREREPVEEDEHSPIERILHAFRDGFGTLVRTGRPTAIGVLTVIIWILYGFVAWIPFVMLDLAAPYGIGPVEGWGLMLIGAIGILIPSPGGIGSYHYIMTESLEILYSMPETAAATYALLVHTGQMLLYLVVGFAAILILGRKISLRSDREPESTTVQTP